METAIDNRIPVGKIFKDKTFWVGTFLGGPLAAGYLFAENFKTLGQPEKVKPTWTITIISTIVIFGGIFLIPENINIPNQIIPITYCVIAFSLFKHYQEEKANQHINAGGMVHSWWRVIGVGLISLLISVLPLLTFAYIATSIEDAQITRKSYGLTVQHEIDFNKENISEQEVDNIAQGFTETGFFDDSVAKYVYLDKNENKYEVFIFVMERMLDDNQALQPFVDLRTQMDEYLPGHTIEFKLVVDYLDNVVKVLK